MGHKGVREHFLQNRFSFVAKALFPLKIPDFRVQGKCQTFFHILGLSETEDLGEEESE